MNQTVALWIQALWPLVIGVGGLFLWFTKGGSRVERLESEVITLRAEVAALRVRADAQDVQNAKRDSEFSHFARTLDELAADVKTLLNR